MCFSAMVEQDLKTLERQLQAQPDFESFEMMYSERLQNAAIKTCKALDANFLTASSHAEERIRALVAEYRESRKTAVESELFKQKTRLNTAQRALASKPTRKAENDRRIASDKVVKLELQLRDLQSPAELKPSHSRIFPMIYAPGLSLGPLAGAGKT
jgi:hypothetical protein